MRNPFVKITSITLLIAFVMICYLMLAGCASYIQKRNIARQHLYNYEYPNELAKDCLEQFPVKDSVGKIIFTPALNVDYTAKIDSLELLVKNLSFLLDTRPAAVDLPASSKNSDLSNTIAQLKSTIETLKSAYKPCKPDTVKQPIYRIDNAAVEVWQDKYKVQHDSVTTVKAQYYDKQKSMDAWRLIAIICLVVITGSIIWKIYKAFNGGAVADTADAIIKKL